MDGCGFDGLVGFTGDDLVLLTGVLLTFGPSHIGKMLLSAGRLGFGVGGENTSFGSLSSSWLFFFSYGESFE